jgi:excisionase family DNA binding protein
MYKNKTEPTTLTLLEVSERYGLPLDSLRTYVRQKRIPVYKIGRVYRVRLSEFESWIDAQNVEIEKQHICGFRDISISHLPI